MCIGYIQEQSEKELNKIVNAGIKEGRSTAQQDNDCTQLRFWENPKNNNGVRLLLIFSKISTHHAHCQALTPQGCKPRLPWLHQATVHIHQEHRSQW